MAVRLDGKSGNIKAVCFDFMGTCLDWHTVVTAAMPRELFKGERTEFALAWRQTYFDANAARLRAGEKPEDIDITHAKTLDVMLDQHVDVRHLFTDEIKADLIAAWHKQKAWIEVPDMIKKLKENLGYEVFVFANGTTRLQLDLVKSAGLNFDMLFSSELLDVYKPAPESYQRFLKLIQTAPENCVMVAAHAYDVQGAKEAGMRTIYIDRWTDDIEEDKEKLKTEFDAYLDDMSQLDVAISKL